MENNRNEYMREYLKKRRDTWISANGPCKQCGSDIDLEIDHIDSSTKAEILVEKSTGYLWRWPESQRIAELSKCQVLCRVCHIEKTRLELTKHPEHGTWQRWCKKCKCEPCRVAYNAYMRIVGARYRERQRTKLSLIVT